MKIRNGFVSNSSSSSFIITKSKHKLNTKQVDQIINYDSEGQVWTNRPDEPTDMDYAVFEEFWRYHEN